MRKPLGNPISKEETEMRACRAGIHDGRLLPWVEDGDPVLFQSIKKTIQGPRQ